MIKSKEMAKKTKGDISLLVAVALLSIIGTIFVYSASNYSASATYNDSFYFVKKQIIGVLLGIVAMIAVGFFDFEKLKKIAPYICIISVILLVLVFVPSIGVESYGAKRWLNLGFFTIQPSELAKFSLILFSATYLSSNSNKGKRFIGCLPVVLFGCIICVLVMLEPNMSITVCIALLMLTILFASGIKLKKFMFLIIPALVLAVVLIIIEPYRLKRLMAFLNPWSNPKGEGYQLLQSLYALGSGGWFGVGLFNSRQKFAFLPFAESDFILSVIGEEIGFVGLIFLFLLMFFIIIRGLIIASKAKNLFGFLLAVGITMIFGIQTIINALVVTGSIPPTGLSLPLVSSGNTSIVIFMTEIGILYNISKNKSLTF